MTPQAVGTLGVYLSAFLATLSLGVFSVSARFWSSRGGWHVFWYMLMVAWVLDLSSISHLFDPPWFAWFRFATFAVGFPLVLVWRLWIIFDLQLRRRQERDRVG